MLQNPDYKIILGSNSPRRKELLAGLNVHFTVDTLNNFKESFPPETPACDVPVLMARGKSAGFHRPLIPGEILITADTVVICNGSMVLGKPHSREEAVCMLRQLSGQTHEVETAVVFRTFDSQMLITDTTHVSFEQLTDSEIDYYLDKYSPFDKAGSYGVQEWIGFIAIGHIDGSYYNVMGFPIHKFYKALKELNAII